MIAVEITRSEWLYNAIQGKEVLTISRDYFRLRRGLERRLYELDRKHCGRQPKWKVSLDVLHKKSGSTSPLKKYRLNIKQIAKSKHLPDYLVAYDEENDQAIFYNRGPKGQQEQIKDILQRDLF